MGDTTYPNLGFNPVPGLPDDVAGMGNALSTAVGSLTEANGLLGRLRSGDASLWQGQAADAFRSHLNETLLTDLNHAQESLTKATNVLQTWHTDLVEFKETANRLDQQAGSAKQHYDDTTAQLESAQSNPDLQLAGQFFTDANQLQQAQRRLDAAENGVRNAARSVDDAKAAFDAIIRQAKELEDDHHKTAKKAADQLKDATKNLAPKKPGLFSRLAKGFCDAVGAVGDWIKDHLDDIHAVLSTISAVAGLIALVTPPPIDAIALGVSVVAGAGALACDLANPEFRHQMGRLFHGEFDSKSLGAGLTAFGDVVSVVPVWGAAKGAIKGVEGVKGLAGMAKGLSQGAHAGIVTDFLAKQATKFSCLEHAASAVTKAGEAVPVLGKVVNSTVVKVGLEVSDKGKVLYNVTEAGATISKAVNAANKVKGVATNVYHDIKKAVE